jgi:hypothetical protein
MKLLILTMTLMMSVSVFACGGDKMDDGDKSSKEKTS